MKEILKYVLKYIATFLFVELGSAIIKSLIQMYGERNAQLV